jgi:hypothetical protein
VTENPCSFLTAPAPPAPLHHARAWSQGQLNAHRPSSESHSQPKVTADVDLGSGGAGRRCARHRGARLFRPLGVRRGLGHSAQRRRRGLLSPLELSPPSCWWTVDIPRCKDVGWTKMHMEWASKRSGRPRRRPRTTRAARAEKEKQQPSSVFVSLKHRQN